LSPHVRPASLGPFPFNISPLLTSAPGVLTSGKHSMTHFHTLCLRILPSKPALSFATSTRIHNRTASSSCHGNAKPRYLTSTAKSRHTNDVDVSKNVTMRHSREVDVLIVGAGPAGLTMASSLVRAGISFRIIDRRYACGHWTLLHPSHLHSHL
jgi:FAD binding domain